MIKDLDEEELVKVLSRSRSPSELSGRNGLAMLLTDDISFLQVEAIQVIKCILGLYNKMRVTIKPVSINTFFKK